MIEIKNMHLFKKIINNIIEKVYNQLNYKNFIITTPFTIVNNKIFKPNMEYVNQNDYTSLNIISIINCDDNGYGYYIYFDD